MKVQIRRDVFETNSSSVHTLTICLEPVNIEKYAGMFPTWLCPEQVRIIPISEKFNDYASKVEAQLKEEGIRCSVDGRSEKMGYKIREARLERVPYMLVVGAKEEE